MGLAASRTAAQLAAEVLKVRARLVVRLGTAALTPGLCRTVSGGRRPMGRRAGGHALLAAPLGLCTPRSCPPGATICATPHFYVSTEHPAEAGGPGVAGPQGAGCSPYCCVPHCAIMCILQKLVGRGQQDDEASRWLQEAKKKLIAQKQAEREQVRQGNLRAATGNRKTVGPHRAEA